MITNYKDKKLIEYLKDGQKILIRFGHGLGDTLLFMPIFYKLKTLYPQVQFDLYVESGQEEIFESVSDKDAQGYDHVFHLNFPMSEGWGGVSKPEKCCLDEIGIEPITKVVDLKPFLYDSPIVAIHFQGTALPDSVGCSEVIAKQIWQEVKDCGKIPLEVHFEHCWHNPVNKKFDFINSTVRGSKASLFNLIGLIRNSCAFIGVASGPFIVALSVIPERTLFLEKAHKLYNYTKEPIAKIDLSNFQPGSIKSWLLNTLS